jgi:serine/threonine protein kinase
MMNTEVPGYVLRELIGTGSSAAVWRGEAVGTPGRLVAVKVVAHTDGGAAIDALRREGEVLTRLSHPSILQVVDLVATDAGLALVTPFAAGGSLADALAHAPGGLPAAMVADIGARLASALAAMHGAGIVHRDIKPANVLFDREHQPLLADVGIARLRGEAAEIAGTADYRDPELLAGREPAPRSDLYALGVTLYEALAGVPPYVGATADATVAAADRGRFLPLASHVDAPLALTTVIEAAFARDVAARPAGAHELAGRLDEIRRSLEQEETGPPPPPGGAVGRAGVLGAVPSTSRPKPTTSRRTLPRPTIPTPASRPAPRPVATPSDPASGPPSTATPDGSSDPRAEGGRSGTVVWGRPPPDDEAPEHRPRRVPRSLLVSAAVAIVLVPVVVVAISSTGGGSSRAPNPAPNESASDQQDPAIDDPAAADTSTPPPSSPTPSALARDPGPACQGLEPPDDGREVVLADVTGRGCSAIIAWDGRRLEVLDGDGSTERYDLGAQPDDILLFGDWTCDGRDAPALYRPEDSRLFTFDQLVDSGEQISATGTPTGVVDGTPRVVTDEAGCDRVEMGS